MIIDILQLLVAFVLIFLFCSGLSLLMDFLWFKYLDFYCKRAKNEEKGNSGRGQENHPDGAEDRNTKQVQSVPYAE